MEANADRFLELLHQLEDFSEATVKTHVNRIFAKTASRDRAQATRYAYTHGYADPA